MTQAVQNTLKLVQDIASLATDKAITQGVKNIETWMERLEREEFRGAKTIHENLGKLKRQLEADSPDAKAIAELLKTLGEETVRAAGQDKEGNESIQRLGEALIAQAGRYK